MRQLFLLILLALPAQATNWFAGPTAQGAASGTSWASRWNYTNVTWASIGASDTLYLDQGTYPSGWAIFPSGSPGSAGTYPTVSVSNESGHDGGVIFNASNAAANLYGGTETFGMVVCGAHYVHLNGLHGTNQMWWIINTQTSLSDREAGRAYYGGSPHDQLIEGIVASNVNNGFMFNSSANSNIVIRYCTVRYARADYAFRCSGFSSGSFTNYVIHNCDVLLNADFSGSNGGPDGLGGGGGLTFHDNIVKWTNGVVVPGQHPDGVQELGNGFCLIYNNQFRNPLNSGVKFEPLAPATYWSSCLAYNNLVCIDDPTYAASGTFNGKGFELGSGGSMSGVTNILIANNTIVDMLGLGINGGSGCWPVTSFGVTNNLIYNCGKNAGAGSQYGPAAVILDYNSVTAGATGFPNLSIATNCTGSGYTNFVQAHIPGTPTFTQYTPYSATNVYNLTANVAGADLSAYFATDITGATRTVPWTIGAYQASTPASTTNPPVVVLGKVVLRGAVNLRVGTP